MRAGTKVAAPDPAGSADTAFPRQWNWTWLANLLGALALCLARRYGSWPRSGRPAAATAQCKP